MVTQLATGRRPECVKEMTLKYRGVLKSILSSRIYLHEDYECPICDGSAFPCGCFKTPTMEKEVDIAIRDYNKKRFDPYMHFRQDKLCIWVHDGKKLFARWDWDKERGRSVRAILPKWEQELYQALLRQRLAVLNLELID